MQITKKICNFLEHKYDIMHVLLTGWFLPMPPAMAALSALIVAENRKPKPERKHEMQYLYRPIPHSYSAYVKKRLWYFGVLHGLYLPLGAKTPINSMQLFVIWDYWLVKKLQHMIYAIFEKWQSLSKQWTNGCTILLLVIK